MDASHRQPGALTGAALFLGAYQTLFLLLGVLSNVVGVVDVLGILKRHRLFPERRSVLSLIVRGPVDRALYPVAIASAVLFIGAVIFAAGQVWGGAGHERIHIR